MPVPLGEIATYVRGVTYKPDDVVEAETPGARVCLRTKNIQAEVEMDDLVWVRGDLRHREDQRVKVDDILISAANSWNLVGRGARARANANGALIGGFIGGLRLDQSRVDPAYGYYWFSSAGIQATIRSFGRQTTSISNLDVSRTLSLPVPLPPLPEQRRIAAILDEADADRARRRELLTTARVALQAGLSAMFAESTTAIKQSLGDVLTRIDSGESPVCEARPAGADEWGVLKLGSVTTGDYLAAENKAIASSYTPRAEHEVRRGDLLLSRKNTLEHVGASVYVSATRARLLLPDLIFRLVPSNPRSAATLQAYLALSQTRRALSNMAGGSANSMANISKERLRTLRVPVFSEDLIARTQRAIAASNEAITSIKASIDSSDALFASLQHRAFRGEL